MQYPFSDSVDFESKPDDQLALLRERVSAIRRWLKDQYILYRDYCTVAQAINARYVPTTLEDTKKVGTFLLDSSRLLSITRQARVGVNAFSLIARVNEIFYDPLQREGGGRGRGGRREGEYPVAFY